MKNATVAPPSSGVGRKGMETSVFTGYANTATHEGLSWSLEGYLNDYGIARMGEELYKKTKKARYKEESAYFLNRAQKYVKLFDEKAGFFQGKKPNGDWRLPSDQYDPPCLGLRLHRDQRLGLRLHRPAGQPGPGQPVRRPRGARQEAGHVLLHAGDGGPGVRRQLRRGYPRDDRGA
ncbi:hypothetical protein SBADM41S_04908 [Streptomyces badius]